MKRFVLKVSREAAEVQGEDMTEKVALTFLREVRIMFLTAVAVGAAVYLAVHLLT